MNLTFMVMALRKLRSNNNPFTCELHQILFDILDFNPELKVINITLAYENDENDIEFEVAEKKDRLKLLMTSSRELSAPTKKKY